MAGKKISKAGGKHGAPDVIRVRGARAHNLKNVSVDIPKNALVVVTGLSGSGKSSLAFDTIYAEGQRRYMESLSSYARQFLELQDKPDVDEISGLSPTIAIDQKTVSSNPRSTVGTITEIYDFFRLLFARVGKAHCPNCGKPVAEQTPRQIVDRINALAKDQGLLMLAPIVKEEKGEQKKAIEAMFRAGYREARVDGSLYAIEELTKQRLDRDKRHTIEAVIARIQEKNPAYDEKQMLALVGKALEMGDGFLTLHLQKKDEDLLMSRRLACADCGISLPEIEPRIFSFNSPHGACPGCTGLGVKLTAEPGLVIPNDKLTLAQGAIKPWTRIAGSGTGMMKELQMLADRMKFSLDVPVSELPKKALEAVLYGDAEFQGVIPHLEKKHLETDSEYMRKEIEEYMRTVTCPVCKGQRLRKEALGVKVTGKNISEFVSMSIEELGDTFKKIDLPPFDRKIADQIVKEVSSRLFHLLEVGLGYLTLDRSVTTLSGGEGQRVRLATQLGTSLSGVIYILDEPSIGLHPRDNDKLIEAIKSIRDVGNSVIVVEHDEAMIEAADYVFDMGPGAGEFGGEVTAEGTPSDIKKNKNSLTGQYLSGKQQIVAPKESRKGSGKSIQIIGATAFNLKNVDVKIPLGKLVSVTGVSGSGKSTLVIDILATALAKKFYRAKEEPGAHKAIKGIEHIDKIITIDQSPIGRTPRSNPATYTGVFTAIRDLFTEVPEAKMKGYDAGKFSFNVKGGGRCETCAGEGYQRIEMQFLPDVFVECPECKGARYNHEALEIHIKDKTIADVLNMTVEEARRFFSDVPAVFDKLDVLHDVGLGYLKLGQPATNLSGGEAQRVKLATELSRRATGKTLYILDEPTTGLHFEDIKRLLGVLDQLVEKGNTVVTIEHNLDVIKCSDWVIDMGPEGGDKGGKLVAEGAPKAIVKAKASLTGRYLKSVVK
ncbi:MAG: excinuclease ABC subunit UvrA [Patescibacteria group bacterium]|nr:MAG: excinuclease ABC subunit UvrA [Patescibacteria group bacterium]